MKNDLISIIIPVYNVENYLVKCVESILLQDYSNIEIILVDDGSTDNSGKICDNYSKKNNNIYTYHKKNGGLSSARNYGIKKSNGTYITFIDSDDYISSKFISTLYKAAKNHSSELVISGLINFMENDVVKQDDLKLNIEKVIDKETALKKMLLQDGIDVNATAKLYKKEIFNDITFPEGKLYEDIQIVDKVVEKANNIVQITYRGYFYLQRKNSIMYSQMSEDRLVLIDKMEEMIKLSKKNYPSIVEACIKRYIYCNFHLLGRSILNNGFLEISINLRTNILKYKKIILSSKLFLFKEKVATIILFCGLNFYRMFWKFYCLVDKKKLEF